MDYSVRTGPREELVSTLRRFQADRLERGESERGSEAARAADALERGEDGAYFERVIYAPGEADRYSVIGGDRQHVAGELAAAAAGWAHQDKPQLAAQARDALARLEQGADTVRVGHLLYAVRG